MKPTRFLAWVLVLMLLVGIFPAQALAAVQEEGCDVLLSEIDFGGYKWEGLEFAKKMKSINPKVNIIFVTAFSEWDFAREVIQMRVSGFVTKPYEEERLANEFANLRYPLPSANASES